MACRCPDLSSISTFRISPSGTLNVRTTSLLPVCFFSGRCVTRKLRYFFLLESVISDLPLGVEWRDRMGLHGDEAGQLDKSPIAGWDDSQKVLAGSPTRL